MLLEVYSAGTTDSLSISPAENGSDPRWVIEVPDEQAEEWLEVQDQWAFIQNVIENTLSLDPR